MMSITEKLKSFAAKYSINVLSDSKRCVKHRPINYHFSEELDKDIYRSMGHYETEPVLTIEVPLSKIESIAEVESTFYNNVDDVYRRRHFEEWMKQQSEERYLRSKYPSCQTAYEHYSLMLHLCSENPYKPK